MHKPFAVNYGSAGLFALDLVGELFHRIIFGRFLSDFDLDVRSAGEIGRRGRYNIVVLIEATQQVHRLHAADRWQCKVRVRQVVRVLHGA